MKIHRSLSILVCPESNNCQLLSKMGLVCDEVRDALYPQRNDPYLLPVDLISPGEHLSFDQASAITSAGGHRRHLSLRELLALTLRDPAIRARWPIYAGDYVIQSVRVDDYADDDEEEPERMLRIGLSAYHQGSILDAGSLFATTLLTRVDKDILDESCFASLMATPQTETPRLTA